MALGVCTDPTFVLTAQGPVLVYVWLCEHNLLDWSELGVLVTKNGAWKHAYWLIECEGVGSAFVRSCFMDLQLHLSQ